MAEYPLPSAPTTCAPGQVQTIVRRNWRFGQVDPASEKRSPRGRITAWCVACGTVLEVQEEHTGVVLYSGLPHGRASMRPSGLTPADVRDSAQVPDPLHVVRELRKATVAYLAVLEAAGPTAEAMGEQGGELLDELRAAQRPDMGTPAAIDRTVRELLGES